MSYFTKELFPLPTSYFLRKREQLQTSQKILYSFPSLFLFPFHINTFWILFTLKWNVIYLSTFSFPLLETVFGKRNAKWAGELASRKGKEFCGLGPGYYFQASKGKTPVPIYYYLIGTLMISNQSDQWNSRLYPVYYKHGRIMRFCFMFNVLQVSMYYTYFNLLCLFFKCDFYVTYSCFFRGSI